MRRIRFIHQKKVNECGVAVLKMVADFFLSEQISYEDIRWLCHISSKGMSVYTLCKVANLLGMNAYPIKITYENFIINFSDPVIAFINANHFVVLSPAGNEYVRVCDPAIGEKIYNYKEFHELWMNHIGKMSVVIVIDVMTQMKVCTEGINKSDGKQVVVFVMHKLNTRVLDNIHKLKKECDNNRYDVYLLFCNSNLEIDLPYGYCEIIPENELKTLGYNLIGRKIIPGNTHLLLLDFYLRHQQYIQYWVIEYDVEFSGDWLLLFDDCYDNLYEYDFLSCHIEKYCKFKNKEWPWWYMRNRVGFPYYQCVKGFNPICRYSNRALACLDQYMKQGFSAHSEVMITTCLYHHGMKIGDIGGQGEFVPKGWENRYYLAGEGVNNGTMRYRPVYTREEIEETGLKNMLFHPLKE